MPVVRPIERIVALLNGVAIVFITVPIWRSVAASQPIWPFPAWYFIELVAVGVLGAAAFWFGAPFRTVAAWAAAGIFAAFVVLGAFSVGLAYLVPALLFLALAIVAVAPYPRRILAHLGVFLAAAAAQTAIMFAFAGLF